MACCAVVCAAGIAAQNNSAAPHLEKHGTATQLVVDGRPFLILGGELHNSSSSSLDYMRPIWPRLTALHMNTVLAPVSWELIEPEEGRFDFALVDGLIHDTRSNNLRLVFLWFGSWKNGVSTYVPAWVKADSRRFPRAKDKNGRTLEILTTFSDAGRDADSRAFAALMRHIRDVDAQSHTVLMMQVENEVGVLGDSRDRSAAANAAFASPVPAELHAKTTGSWEQVFGPGVKTDEMFMAWQYARYVGHVAAAGKAEYPIPMYVNAWLEQVGTPEPGKYPSGGPQAKLMDVWRAGAPSIDMIEPDIYVPEFEQWCDRYHRSGNPLFIPETYYNGRGPADAFYAFGQHEAIGYSPFAIDDVTDGDAPIGRSYELLSAIAPVILAHEGQSAIAGAVLDKDHKSKTIPLAGYNVEFRTPRPEIASAIAIATGRDEFLIAGMGLTVAFSAPGSEVGLLSVEEGTYVDGRWIPERRLNGDEIESGKGAMLPPDHYAIERVKLYRY